MKLAVFVCILAVLHVAVGSCVNETVEVVVANGVGLDGDFLSKPDPYIVVQIGDDKKRTRTINSSSNPTWWKTFIFDSVSSNFMTIEIWDEDGGLNGSDDNLGVCKEELKLSSGQTAVRCTTTEKGVVNLFYRCY